MPAYDLELFVRQQNVIHADDPDQAARFIKWLTSLGYYCSGPREETTPEGTVFKVYAAMNREMIASTKHGDLVQFTGQYQVKKADAFTTAVLPDVPGWVITGVGEP